jgi:hypothetical protein
MTYKPRIEVPYGYYHVVTRGNNKRQIYEDDQDRESFLVFLERIARRYGWLFYAYVRAQHSSCSDPQPASRPDQPPVRAPVSERAHHGGRVPARRLQVRRPEPGARRLVRDV